MVINQKIVTRNTEETKKLGASLAKQLLEKRGEDIARIVCLYGELGSGKTTFVQGFARGLRVKSRLLSPTFIIVRRYDLHKTSGFLYHLDLYRLGGKLELEGLGLTEILTDTNSVVLIEWAEKLKDLLPKKRIDIHFTVLPSGHHRIDIKKYG